MPHLCRSSPRDRNSSRPKSRDHRRLRPRCRPLLPEPDRRRAQTALRELERRGAVSIRDRGTVRIVWVGLSPPSRSGMAPSRRVTRRPRRCRGLFDFHRAPRSTGLMQRSGLVGVRLRAARRWPVAMKNNPRFGDAPRRGRCVAVDRTTGSRPRTARDRFRHGKELQPDSAWRFPPDH